jgi:lysophospholipase L1-like esterase
MRICAFGDSGILGHLDPEQLGWAGRLQALARANQRSATVYNLGIRGDSSRQVRARWRQEAEVRLPQNDTSGLIFSFGVNDATVLNGGEPRVSRKESEENFRAIAADAMKLAPTFFVGSFPISEHTQPSNILGVTMEVRNDWIEEVDELFLGLAAQGGVPYLSLFRLLKHDSQWAAAVAETDGVHLPPHAHMRIAETVAAWEPWAELIRSA